MTSPNDSETEVKMRADLGRLKELIHDHEMSLENGWYEDAAEEIREENHLLRELLTSYMAITQADFQTDNRLRLNVLCRRVLESEQGV